MGAVIVAATLGSLHSVQGQPPNNASDPNRLASLFLRPDNATQSLHEIYRYALLYRAENGDKWPQGVDDMNYIVMRERHLKGRDGFESAGQKFFNPDVKFSERRTYNLKVASPYFFVPGAPSPTEPAQVLLATDLYNITSNNMVQHQAFNPRGGYVVLWSDGNISRVPYDEVTYEARGKGWTALLPGQNYTSEAALLRVEELQQVFGSNIVLGKPVVVVARSYSIVPDDGGPESLVALSRLMGTLGRYGIEREDLWRQLDPAQKRFTLSELQFASAALKLPLELKSLTLDALQKRNVPAIFLTTDKRYVLISQLGETQAIVVDQGKTSIVTREKLAQIYTGQALVPALINDVKAPKILVDDPVRVIPLTSIDQPTTAQLKLTNTGVSALTLRIEHPIPGIEKAELSTSTLAPGESTTLNLTLRWRPVLTAPSQNVIVSLSTNDPLHARLALGFQLDNHN